MNEENQPSEEPIELPGPQPEAGAAAQDAPQAPDQWPAAPAPAYPAAPAPAYPAAAYPPPPYDAGPKTSSNSIIALVLAIASWVVCPIVPAIVALVFASMAAKEIDASGDRLQGRGLVTASRIVSWINIGFTVAVIVITAFVLVIVAIAGGFDNVKNS